MSYIEQTLLTGENVTYRDKYHWWYLVYPLFLLLVGFWVKDTDSTIWKYIAYFLILLGFIKLLNRGLNMLTSEFVVTNRRVILKTGFIKRRMQELLLSKAEAIACSENSIIGRLLGFGSIIVTTGGAANVYSFIKQPMAFGKAIQEAVSNTLTSK